MYEAHFERDGDITDHAMLKQAGIDAGMILTEVETWLKSDNGREQVDHEMRRAKVSIADGVPRFIIQSKYGIDGADDPSAFLEVLAWVKAAMGREGMS